MKWRFETRREKRDRINFQQQKEKAEKDQRRQAAEKADESNKRIGAFYEAFRHRKDSPEAYRLWEAAFRQAYVEIEEKYRELWRALQCFKDRKPADSEHLVQFLERDEWFFRSGYAKADCIQILKCLDLPTKVEGRLRTVVLNAVDQRDRREFRHYCKLARKVDSPELRVALRERLSHPDVNVRQRATWALYACEQKDGRKTP